jgi:predicted HD phosphohydrolase
MQKFTTAVMEPLFWILEETTEIIQTNSYHPEGSVLNHSLQAMHHAFKETNDTDLILATMLHDVGKIAKNHGHEKVAIELLFCHCSPKTLWLIKNHMRVWNYILGEMRGHKKEQELVQSPWIIELMQLARFDKMGRNPNKKMVLDRADIIAKLNKCVDKRYNLI